MTEDLSRGTSEDVSEAVESGADMVVSGVEGAEELIGQAAIDVPAPGPNQVDTYQTQPGQVYNLLFPPAILILALGLIGTGCGRVEGLAVR